MAHSTTCRCAACASIGSLDPKFVAHYGEFTVQRERETEDLAGPDVILAHRLLKNDISERTGVEAYVFFTDACLHRMASTFVLPRHAETYESFGKKAGGVHDLAPILAEMREMRREYISPADADVEMTLEAPFPPAVVWRYIVDPVERLRWACRLFDRNPDRLDLNARGRLGARAKYHCSHGGPTAIREYVDWRPFSYFTCHTMTPFAGLLIVRRAVTETTEFVPREDGGTTIHYRIRAVNRGMLSRLMFQQALTLYRGGLERAWRTTLLSVIEDDAAALDGAAQREQH